MGLLRQEARCVLLHRQALEGLHAASVLPKVDRRLESGEFDEVLQMFKDVDVMGLSVEWRCLTDWFLCLVMPPERDACLAFYNDQGPRLDQIYNAVVLRKMDTYLTRYLEMAQAAIELEAEIVCFREGST